MAGGGGAKPQDGKKVARIEIIPLIDVIFFLLATFVLFTLSLNKISSLPVQLPVAGQGGAVDPNDTTVTLQASEEDTCYWNKELIGFNEVPDKLKYYKTNTPNPRVLIAGDDKAKYGSTIRILDEVRKVGIVQVSIETRVRPTGK
jgi:biopolymer transport protein ExbD